MPKVQIVVDNLTDSVPVHAERTGGVRSPPACASGSSSHRSGGAAGGGVGSRPISQLSSRSGSERGGLLSRKLSSRTGPVATAATGSWCQLSRQYSFRLSIRVAVHRPTKSADLMEEKHVLGKRELRHPTPCNRPRVGVHGDSVDPPNEMAHPRPPALAKVGNLSASQLGRLLARRDANAKQVMHTGWETPTTSMGNAGLFDTSLGGNKVSFHGKAIFRQHMRAPREVEWYGRLGYRPISSVEPYMADPERAAAQTRKAGRLLPSRPAVAKLRAERQGALRDATVPRAHAPDTWNQYLPGQFPGALIPSAVHASVSWGH